ncbi:two-component sensor histidine kinase [Pseudoclavibacter sp. RFBJ3]|uniref:sensor histidine kinase n=1 Tax=unclassified Pseudoclavibacter TaxID=2615177 RepID=UPI000CE76DA3|nr:MULTISPECIES: histidine kinase [unclassified Pseudoclavibacter]PPF81365.1 two-component sensor histidine kinase [Pseudoclavibacter sp. RFBJ5]PPF90696.1 two-component sensor histidine kinase [Pseudoclavibacter sp. RFBJ3]PPF95091.1 two-component sensor histidine kinase [Pseudoclavibacter sp. RFBH5]PPG20993.1 two-component sensor histidine kinase [Pseudoclavibacter sp. RFBI4]
MTGPSEGQPTRASRFTLGDAALLAVYVLFNGSILGWQALYVGIPVGALAPELVMLAVGCIAISLRRAAPAVAISAAALTFALAVPLQLPADLFVLAVVTYSIAAGGTPRVGIFSWVGLSLVAAISASTLRLVVDDPPLVGRWQVDLLLILGVGVAALLIGLAVGMRRRFIASLIQLAEELTIERDRSAQLATHAERARIAREVHDIFSHGLQVIVSSADGASAVLDRDPDQARGLLAAISDTGRRSMREARTVFSLLNDAETPADPAPQPSLDALPEFIDRSRDAGLDVLFTEEGTPDLDATRQLVAYRVTQEALTNTLRHAGRDARVDVTLTHSPSGSCLEVVDDGPPSGAPLGAASRGSGSGLIGMRQRLDIVAGMLEAGPRAHHPGWRVRAVIPSVAASAGKGLPS